MGIKTYFVNKMLHRGEKKDAEWFAGKVLPSGVIAECDIPYCNDNLRGHLLDVYFPEKAEGKLPVIIDIHGGGFMSGSKELDRLYGYEMAKRGFLVFNLNYRLAFFDTKVPGQVKDIALAAKWIKEHLSRYDGDGEKVFLCGHSAGGVLALMEALASLSPEIQKCFEIPAGGFHTYRGIILDCGMMTFYENAIGYWGMRTMAFDKGYQKQEYYRYMQWEKVPEIKQLPPIYLISNQKDELRHMTLRFQKLLEENAIAHKMNFQTEKALGHISVIYEPDSEACAEILDEMEAYLLR